MPERMKAHTKRAILKARRVSGENIQKASGGHFVGEHTKGMFTKQGAILVSNVLPKAGVDLRITATQD